MIPALDFHAQWEVLGAVAGAMVVGQEQGYGYTDVSPLPSAYHCLRMADRESSSAFSLTVYLEREKDGKMQVYSNPT